MQNLHRILDKRSEQVLAEIQQSCVKIYSHDEGDIGGVMVSKLD